MKYFTKFLLVVLLLLNISSANARGNFEPVSDPIEPINRGMFFVNSAVDKFVFEPVARGYRKFVPKVPRAGVRNVLRNLREPLNFVNSVLQLDAEQSFTTFWRFVINSTWGLGGIFDFATVAGLEYRQEDFGQTLGRYGVGSGPYLVLPLFGSSNLRDFAGQGVDAFTDPFNITVDSALGIGGRNAVSAIDARESVLDITDRIEKTSFDPYATYRSLYEQRRDVAIANGERN